MYQIFSIEKTACDMYRGCITIKDSVFLCILFLRFCFALMCLFSNQYIHMGTCMVGLPHTKHSCLVSHLSPTCSLPKYCSWGMGKLLPQNSMKRKLKGCYVMEWLVITSPCMHGSIQWVSILWHFPIKGGAFFPPKETCGHRSSCCACEKIIAVEENATINGIVL